MVQAPGLPNPLEPAMSRPLPALLALAIALALPAATLAGDASAAESTAAAASPANSKAAQLNQLYTQYWEESLKLNPLRATFQGDPRYNDQLPNFLSAEYREKSRRFAEQWLSKVEAV